jgi:diguanylate cyclase (GGDEF)-like protein/PAS domain S-box-containing protein
MEPQTSAEKAAINAFSLSELGIKTREDIRMETRGEESTDPYRLMLTQVTIEKLADMVIWIDEDGHYVFVNPAATVLLGYTADEFSRMSVCDVDPEFDQARWQEHWTDLVEKRSVVVETFNRSKAGVDIPIEVTANLVEYQGRRFNCSIVRDIRERKRIEAEMRDLNEQIYKLSVTDALTGLANRRHFDHVLASEMERHAVSGAPLSLVFIDFDAFKSYNDLYGHVEGDEALSRIAAAFGRLTAGSAYTAARYGGEEFAYILPETEHATAQALCERSRQDIAALAIPHKDSPVADHVTASFGVITATCSPHTQAVDLLRAADTVLYRAKHQGRNQVVGNIIAL